MQVCSRPRANVQRADTLGAIDFVRGKRHQVDRPTAQVNVDLAHRLGGVYMQ
ncbi:hypothetical protein D3C81_2316040 [compost metagenome]